MGYALIDKKRKSPLFALRLDPDSNSKIGYLIETKMSIFKKEDVSKSEIIRDAICLSYSTQRLEHILATFYDYVTEFFGKPKKIERAVTFSDSNDNLNKSEDLNPFKHDYSTEMQIETEVFAKLYNKIFTKSSQNISNSKLEFDLTNLSFRVSILTSDFLYMKISLKDVIKGTLIDDEDKKIYFKIIDLLSKKRFKAEIFSIGEEQRINVFIERRAPISKWKEWSKLLKDDINDVKNLSDETTLLLKPSYESKIEDVIK